MTVAAFMIPPSTGRSINRLRRGLLATSCLILVTTAAQQVLANPQQGSVIAGQASVNQTATTTTINQSSNQAAINWQSFSVAAGEQVRFNQPGPNSVTLNRVVGPDLSTIAGSITANGQIVLINPNGTIFTDGSSITAAGLIATTSNISTQDFMAGSMNYGQSSANANAAVINKGVISIADGGYAVLSAAAVQNTGKVSARLGTVVLGGAKTFRLDFNGDGLLGYQIGQPVDQTPLGPDGKPVQALVSQSGIIAAEGGQVLISARAAKGVIDSVINLSGMVEADTARRDSDGALVLGSVEVDGGGTGTVTSSGTVAARGTTPGAAGGTVKILGDQVALGDSAVVDVSGVSGGGSVVVGGDAHGSGPDRNASTVTVSAGTAIHADAKTAGNGGQVVVWSNQATWFAGKISATGGAVSGNGGSIETSSEDQLDIPASAAITTLAPHGKTGNWTIDPGDIIIQTGGSSTLSGQTTEWTIDPSAITNALATSSVSLSTSGFTGGNGDITVNSAISYSGSNNLTMTADRYLSINASITIGSGTLSLTSGATTSTGISAASGTTLTAGSVSFTDTSGGSISLLGNITTSGTNRTVYVNENAGANSLTIGGTINMAGGFGTFYGGAGGISVLSTGQLTATGTSYNQTILYTYGGPISFAAGSSATVGADTLGLITTYSSSSPAAITIGNNVSLSNNSVYGLSLVGSSITVGTGASIAAGGNAIYLTADTMSLNGSAGSITTSGSVTLAQYTNGTTIGLGTGTGTLQLSAAALSEFSGYSSISIGNNSTGIVSIGGTIASGGPLLITSGASSGTGISMASGSSITATAVSFTDTSGGSISLLGNITTSGTNRTVYVNENAGANSLTIGGTINMAGGFGTFYGGAGGISVLSTGQLTATGTSYNQTILYTYGGPISFAAGSSATVGADTLGLITTYSSSSPAAITIGNNVSLSNNSVYGLSLVGSSITVGTGASIAAGGNAIYLTADTMSLNGSAGSITTSGSVTLAQYTNGTTIGLGTGTGAIQLSAAALSSFSGFSSLSIGNGNTGAIAIGGAITLGGPVSITSGATSGTAISMVSGSSITATSLSITDTSGGSISLLGNITTSGTSGRTVYVNESAGSNSLTIGGIINMAGGYGTFYGGSGGISILGTGQLTATGGSFQQVQLNTYGGSISFAAGSSAALGADALSLSTATSGYGPAAISIGNNVSIATNDYYGFSAIGSSFTLGTGSTIAAAGSSISITADTMSLNGSAGSITTTGSVTLAQYTNGTTIGLGTGTGAIQLSAAGLSSFSGYSSLSIGNGNTGAIAIGGAITLGGPVSITSGATSGTAISMVSGSSITATSLSITDTSGGSISLLGNITTSGTSGRTVYVNESAGSNSLTIGGIINMAGGYGTFYGGSGGISILGTGQLTATGGSFQQVQLNTYGGSISFAAGSSAALGADALSLSTATSGYGPAAISIGNNVSIATNDYYGFSAIGSSFTLGTGSTIAAAGSSISITADTMSLNGSAGSITTTGSVTLAQYTNGTTIGLGTGTGAIQLSAAALSSFSGYSSLSIGNGNTGAIAIGGAITLGGPVSITSGATSGTAISMVSGSSITATSLSITDTSGGSISLLGNITTSGTSGRTVYVNESAGSNSLTIGGIINMAGGYGTFYGGSGGISILGTGQLTATGGSFQQVQLNTYGGSISFAAGSSAALGADALSLSTATSGYGPAAISIGNNVSIATNDYYGFSAIGSSFTLGTGSTIAAAGSSISITADTMSLNGSAGSITTTGSVTLAQYTNGTTIGLGTGTGAIQLSAAALSSFSGFSSLSIGNGNTGAIAIGGAITLGGPVSITSGVTSGTAISMASGSSITATSLSITDTSGGSISLLGNITTSGTSGRTVYVNESAGSNSLTIGGIINMAGGYGTFYGGSGGISILGTGQLTATGGSFQQVQLNTYGGSISFAAGSSAALGADALSLSTATSGYGPAAISIGNNVSIATNDYYGFSAIGSSFTLGTGSTIAAAGSSISITADTMSLNGSAGSITTTGSVTLAQYTNGTTIGLGTGTGAIQLSAAALSSFSGYSSLSIGNGNTGAIAIGGAITLGGPVSITSGASSGTAISMASGSSITATSLSLNTSSGTSVSLLGNITVTSSVNTSFGNDAVSIAGTISAGSGGISLSGGSITLVGATTLNAANGTINLNAAVNSDSSSTPRDLTLNAGTGAIDFNGGLGLINPLGNFSVTAGTFSLPSFNQTGALLLDETVYSLNIATPLTGTTVTLLDTAPSGQNITLNNTVTATGTGNTIVLSTLGYVINNVSGSALNPGSGRWLIYTAGPSGNSFGNLTGGVIDNETYLANPPSSISQTGNQFIYGTVPVITVTADSYMRVYGGVNPTLDYVFTLPSGTTASEDYTGTPTVSTGATSTSSTGTYPIVISLGSLYSAIGDSFTFVNGMLTITPAALTLTATNASKIYGGVNPSFAYTIGGLVNGDPTSDVTGVGETTTATTASGAGSYPINISGGSGGSNYTITSYVPGTLTVTPASLTLTATNESKVYGAVDPSLVFTVSGLVNGDLSSVVTGVSETTTATSASSVASYPISLSGGSGGANYTIGSYVAGSLVITPASLTLTATNASKLYGAVDPSLAFTVSGLVNGDLSSVVTGVSETTTATSASSVGSYPISLSSGSGGANYTIGSYVAGSLTVTPASLTLTATNASKIYGAVDPSLVFSVGGLVNGDTSSLVTGVSETTTATAASNVGSYPISLSGGSSGTNYTIGSYVAGSLSVTPASLTLTATNASKIYGAVDPILAFSVGGLMNGDTSSVVTGVSETTTATAASNVGSYPISLSGGSGGANYTIGSYVAGTLSVTPASLTLTAFNASKVYGAVDPSLAYSVGGLVNGDLSSVVTGVSETTTATAASNVGSYPISLSSGNAGANYTIGGYVAGTLSVTPASLTLTATNATKVYGAVDPSLTYSVSGLVNGDTISIVTGVSEATAATSASNVGSYPITLGGGSAGANYAISSYVAGALTITPASLTLTADDATKLLGATNPTLSYTVAGLVNGDASSVVTGVSETTTATISSGAGNYPITLSGGTAGSNYTITTYVPGTLTISSYGIITVAANSYSRVYGGVNPALGYMITVPAGTTASADYSGTPTITTSATTGSTAGTYPIIPSLGSLYSSVGDTFSFVNGALSVTPAALTLTAGNASRIYGGVNPTLTYGVGGLVNGDMSSIVTGVSETTTAWTSGAGTYPINLSGGSAGPNYTVASYVPGILTIAPATLTLSATSTSRAYGGVNPDLTFSATGLVNGDTASIVTGVSEATTATVSSNVGGYPISISGGSAGANYTITSYVPGTLTVTPAALTLTASNANKIYGAVDPSLAYTVSGLVNGDTSAVVTGVSEATTATTASGAGSYPISLSGGIASADYVLANYVPGALTVTPASLTLTATNAAKIYGAVDPSLAYTVSGLVNGDTSAILTGVTETTTATAASNVGSYPISLSSGGAANYTIAYVAGSLSVTPASLTLTATNSGKIYGAVNPSLTFTASGLVNGDTSSVVTGVSETTTANASSSVGSYPISISGGNAANYSIAGYVPGSLTVTPAALTLTANNSFQIYGAVNLSLGYSIGGLANGDPTSIVTGVTEATTATAASAVGLYPITLTGGSAGSNYVIVSEVPGVLAISQPPGAASITTASILTATQTSATSGTSLLTFETQQLLQSSTTPTPAITQATTDGTPNAAPAPTTTPGSTPLVPVSEAFSSAAGQSSVTGQFGTIASSGTALSSPVGQAAAGPKAEAATSLVPGIAKLPPRPPVANKGVSGIDQSFSSLGGDLSWLDN